MATCYAMHVCISSLKMRARHDSQTLCSLEKFHFPSLQISCTQCSAVQCRAEANRTRRNSQQVPGIYMRVMSFIILHRHITFILQNYRTAQLSTIIIRVWYDFCVRTILCAKCIRNKWMNEKITFGKSQLFKI